MSLKGPRWLHWQLWPCPGAAPGSSGGCCRHPLHLASIPLTYLTNTRYFHPAGTSETVHSLDMESDMVNLRWHMADIL